MLNSLQMINYNEKSFQFKSSKYLEVLNGNFNIFFFLQKLSFLVHQLVRIG